MRFALSREPMDYQLSVHFNNYEQAYGVGSFNRDFSVVMSNPGGLGRAYGAMKNFITHYGKNKIKLFLSDIIQLKGVA